MSDRPADFAYRRFRAELVKFCLAHPLTDAEMEAGQPPPGWIEALKVAMPDVIMEQMRDRFVRENET